MGPADESSHLKTKGRKPHAEMWFLAEKDGGKKWFPCHFCWWPWLYTSLVSISLCLSNVCYVLVDHMFDETSTNSKDLYDGIIKQVVISAMQGINGTTFPPVPVMKSLTLGAHAQLGLQYLVCLSVCLFVRLSARVLALRGGQ